MAFEGLGKEICLVDLGSYLSATAQPRAGVSGIFVDCLFTAAKWVLQWVSRWMGEWTCGWKFGWMMHGGFGVGG